MATIHVFADVNLDNINQSAICAVSTATTVSITSIDGRTLANVTNMPSAVNWTGVASGIINSVPVIVAVSSSTNKAANSWDNVTWVARTMPASVAWAGVAFGGGYFAAIATGPTTSAATTTDGVTWNASTIASGNWKAICSDGGNNFIAVTGAASTLASFSSDNGRNWNSKTLSISGDWRSIAYGNGTWVTLSYNSANASYSTDNGDSWNTSSLSATKNWNSIAYGNGIFVAINSSDNVINTSPDGITWTPGILNMAGGTSICFHPDLKVFVVSSTTTTWGWSSDGFTWISRTVTTGRTTTSVCPTFIRWSSADILNIQEGAIVTCNTNQTKFLKTITITDGLLNILNSSTSTPLVFGMGRSSAATVNSITPASALGIVNIEGNWIEIGTGDNSSGQTLTSPFRDFVPCLWVETGNGTGVYEKWLNITGFMTDSGGDFAPIYNKFNAVSNGIHGRVFVQNETSISSWVFQVSSGATTLSSRVVSVSSTSGILGGAQITGTNIPANSIVDKVLDSTRLLLNQISTGTGSGYTFTIYNPYQAQLGTTLTFGDGVNGNKIPSGARVKVPNIMFTDLTPVNLLTNSDSLTGTINLNSGGTLLASICSFDEAYLNLTQGDTVTLSSVGSRVAPTVTKCFNLTLEDVGISHNISRLYLSAANGFQRRNMAVTPLAGRMGFQYIDNAVISNVDISSYSNVLPASTVVSRNPAGTFLSIEYSKNVSISGFRCFNLGVRRPYVYGILILYSKNISITNLGVYNNISKFGCAYSVGITIDGLDYSQGMWNEGSGTNLVATRNRITYDPSTGENLILGQKYWIKMVTFAEGWKDRTRNGLSLESMPISFTPYDAQNEFHLVNFGVVPTQTVANSVTLNWLSQGVVSGTRAWDIFRSTSEGFTTRDATTLLVSTGTVATVTYVDNGAGLLAAPSEGTTYYYVLRKYHALITVASCTTTNTLNTVTTSNNFNTAISIEGNNFYSGENQVFNSVFAFTALQIGMTVNGTGIPASTTITDIDELGQIITLSNPTTANGFGSTLTFNLTNVRWAVTGTGIPTLAHISSVDSNTQITLDRAANASGTVTLTFLAYTETAETACIPKIQESTTNYCFQSDDFSNDSWVKTSITVTANTRFFPYNGPFFATATADRLTASGSNGTVVQTVTGLSIATTYTAFVTIITDIIPITQTSVSGSITFGTTTTNFTLTDSVPITVSAVFTATAISHTFTIQVNTSGQYIYAGGACVENISSLANGKYFGTTTAAVTINPNRFQILAPRVYCHRGFSGCEFQYTSASGILFGEIHVGTTSNFTPSQSTLWGNTWTATANGEIEIANSSDSIEIKNISHFREGWKGNPFIYLSGLPTNVSFSSGSIKFNGADSRLVNYVLANTTSISDFDIKYPRDYYSGYPLLTSVNVGGSHVLQNIRTNRESVPTTQNAHGIILKGVSGGYQSLNQETASAFSLFSAVDGLTTAYTAVYDTIFNELYFSSTKGALVITFTPASIAANAPYVLNSGSLNLSSPRFNDTGKLFMKYQGDSITYIWPHKIFGVSGFRAIRPRFLGVDIGNFVQTGFGIKAEYSVDTGSGYGSFKEMIPSNLSSETLSASSGFFLKVKLTAKTFMKFSTGVSTFVPGETITGGTSSATAVIDGIEYTTATTGTLRLSSVSGNWIAAELIKSGATTRATNVATNSQPLGPQQTSYISGFEFFTTVDQTVKYPTEVFSLTFTSLKVNSEVRCYSGTDPSTAIELGSVENSGTEFTLLHSSPGVSGYIQIASLNYKNITLPWTYQAENQSIPIQQQLDRQYQNS